MRIPRPHSLGDLCASAIAFVALSVVFNASLSKSSFAQDAIGTLEGACLGQDRSGEQWSNRVPQESGDQCRPGSDYGQLRSLPFCSTRSRALCPYGGRAQVRTVFTISD